MSSSTRNVKTKLQNTYSVLHYFHYTLPEHIFSVSKSNYHNIISQLETEQLHVAVELSTAVHDCVSSLGFHYQLMKELLSDGSVVVVIKSHMLK